MGSTIQLIRCRYAPPVRLLLSVALFTLGCGGDGQSGSSGESPGATSTDSGESDSVVDVDDGSAEFQFLTEYAAQVCAMYRPCCEREGMGYDDTGCTDWFRGVTSAYFQGQLAPGIAEECLNALADARAADDDRCANVPRFDEATFRQRCRQALRTPATQGAELGGDCLLDSDCASAEVGQGTVVCYSGTCMLERRGQVGDGPCNVHGRSVPTELYTCNAADDLYCDPLDDVCKPRLDDGERCPEPSACRETARCTGGVCRTLPGLGEECLNAVAGAGGFCRSKTACDPVTLVCGPGFEAGATCREAAQCLSGLCHNRECIGSDFTLKLNCMGTAPDTP